MVKGKLIQDVLNRLAKVDRSKALGKRSTEGGETKCSKETPAKVLSPGEKKLTGHSSSVVWEQSSLAEDTPEINGIGSSPVPKNSEPVIR